MIVEAHRVSPELLHTFDTSHGFTTYRLDNGDGRRWMTREGWDRYSPRGTLLSLDRTRAERAHIDRQRVKYTPRSRFLPAADNVTRLELEEELFGVRSMKHVFRVKRNIGAQGWATVLNPALPGGYPPHLALTREPDMTEPIFPTGYAPEGAPEYKDWLRRTSKGDGL